MIMSYSPLTGKDCLRGLLALSGTVPSQLINVSLCQGGCFIVSLIIFYPESSMESAASGESMSENRMRLSSRDIEKQWEGNSSPVQSGSPWSKVPRLF